MSNVQHILFVGSKSEVEIDGVYLTPLLPPFTADSTQIYADSTLRFADETN